MDRTLDKSLFKTTGSGAVVGQPIPEHPWDGSRLPDRTKLRPSTKMNSAYVLLFVALICLTPLQGPRSQATLPPTDVSQKKDRPIVLSRDNLEKANDLQDVVQQIERLAYDYQSYLGDCGGSPECEKTNEALYHMLVNFDVGSYYLSPANLNNDIKELTGMLREHESALQKAHDDAKLYRLTKSLRQQLELYEDILQQDVCPELRQDTASAQKIQAYLIMQMAKDGNQKEMYKEIVLSNKELVDKIKSQIEAQRDAIKASSQLKAQQVYILKALDVLRDSLSNIVWVVPPTPPVPHARVGEVPEVPEVPRIDMRTVTPPAPPAAPHVVIVGRDRTFTSESGQSGVVKEFGDSMQVQSQTVPIFINNQTGTLIVTGVDEKVIRVSFTVRVSASDKASADRLIDEITVDLSSAAKGIYVSSHFPAISDPRRNILSSTMEVTVPKTNPLICESSFGRMEVSNVRGGLKANTSYSDVTVSDVVGETKLAGKMGRTELNTVSGPIDVRNSLGDIVLSDCSGTFELENSYATIELDDCSGNAIIRNSGEVNVSGHKGDLKIDNQNGQVVVTDVVGNLDVRNSYKPLTITNVDGTAKLENLNASIDMEDINGTLTAANKFGSISGRFLNGPLEINSERGDVAVELNQYLTGPSSITSSFGLVNLTLSTDAGVMVTAVANGGVIRSDYGSEVDQGQGRSLTKFSVGSAKTPFQVTGTNSTIVITEAK